MKPLLRRALATRDAAVERLFDAIPFVSERVRAGHLFALYEHLTAPTLADIQQPATRGRTFSAGIIHGTLRLPICLYVCIYITR
jgi:hypothetical protein